MPAFAIGLYNIRDTSWRPAYRDEVDKLVAKHGGRYVARTTNPWEVLEGAAPDITNITMIEFPSMEHARAWYSSRVHTNEATPAGWLAPELSSRGGLKLN